MPNFLLPPTLHNEGNYIISLGKLVRWLGEQAEGMGVEIYPGFPADEVLYSDSGAVVGVATKDMGIGKDGQPKDTFMRGMELRAKQTIFAEGARGSCSENVISNFDLRKDCEMQSYGLGIKEVWEVPEEKARPGFVQHTFSWPLQNSDYGGSFLYHMKPNLVLLGCRRARLHQPNAPHTRSFSASSTTRNFGAHRRWRVHQLRRARNQ